MQLDKRLDDRATISAQTSDSRQRIALRGSSGRFYGYLDLDQLVIEIKRKGEAPEQIDLKPFLRQINALS